MVRRLFLMLFCSFAISFVFSQYDSVALRVQLPNGWSLTPAGNSLPLGDLPLNIAVSSSRRLLAVTNNGQSTQSLQLIDAMNGKLIDNITVRVAWLGLKFADHDKSLYVSGGNTNRIFKYAIRNNKLLLSDSIILGKRWTEKISPTGIDIDEANQRLFVTTKENNSLYIVDLISKKTLQQVKLPAEAYTCLLSANRKELFISCWGCEKVLIYNVAQKVISAAINAGTHPNDMCLSRDGKYLYVANAEDNSVSVIDVLKGRVVEMLDAALYPSSPTGSTTNSVALSDDGKQLFIANADNNCIAVFDVSKPGSSRSKGFIPVGWYPTSVKVVGARLFVANGKGFTSKPSYGNRKMKYRGNNAHEGDTTNAGGWQYIGGLFWGSMSIINIPGEKKLAEYSKMVYANTPYNKDNELYTKGEAGNPVPQKIGDTSPVKHVFYIIKENRTYDQVLGDIEGGNGDTSLVLFGEKITPNLHALAREFVLLDNFYVNGEVSADGHNWSLGAYANDYLEKTWVTSYGHRGGSYDSEGHRAIANNKKGFIWDHCKRAGISYRTYGEFADNYKANLPVLEGHFCQYYTGWDMTVADTTRFRQWRRDFDSLLAIDKLPQMNTLRFSNDHTEGMKKGRPTTFAHVADNDLAVGMFVDYLSKSPVWKQSVVIIVEDDAQDGPDHVDAHRSTAYIAGGYVRRGLIDHTMYSTTSLLRTMELILGIPPMSQYDAAANSMWRCFNKVPDTSVFNFRPALVNLLDTNLAENEWQQKSETFDLTKEDAIPDRQFTEVIWKSVKGINAIVPAPRRSAFLKSGEKDDD